MKTALTFLRADHGPAIRQAIGVLAVLAAVTYCLGFSLGRFVYSLNDRLAYGPRDIPAISAPAMLRRGGPGGIRWQPPADWPEPVAVLVSSHDGDFMVPYPHHVYGQGGGESLLEQWQVAALLGDGIPMVQRHAAATLPTLQAPALESLSVAELRKLARQAGHRKLARSGRRQQLLEVLA